ncbi:manganese/iron superoxide dismutase, partial [Kipferlia bialata]|eukprot:g15498.t1
MSYTLPPLPFALDALEPVLMQHQMEVHYTKHHQGYCNKTNAVLKDQPLASHPIEYVLDHVDELPAEIRQKVINVGGGLANHTFFWHSLSPVTQ